jgi:hypothetical protein
MESNNVEYPHLFLRAWPFAIVPNEESRKIWADREKLKAEIDATFNHAITRKISQICIFWAWYGAGKTHSLMHYEWKLNESGDAYVVYTEFPQNAKRFLDLYVTFSDNLNFERLHQISLEVLNYLDKKYQTIEKKKIFRQHVAQNWDDFCSVIEKYAYGEDEEKEIAEKWIRGIQLKKKDRDAISVSGNINTDEDAVKAVSSLARLVTFNCAELTLPKMLFWMIDEYNRIDDVQREDYKLAIRTGLHKVFNRTAKNFCFVLACSTRGIDDVYTILGDALKDRLSVGARPMRIESLCMDEAIKFMKDLLQGFRPSPMIGVTDPFFPFTIESVNYVLSHMLTNNVPLTPRKVMDFHEFVLHENEHLIKEGKIKAITPEYARISMDKIPREFYKI